MLEHYIYIWILSSPEVSLFVHLPTLYLKSIFPSIANLLFVVSSEGRWGDERGLVFRVVLGDVWWDFQKHVVCFGSGMCMPLIVESWKVFKELHPLWHPYYCNFIPMAISPNWLPPDLHFCEYLMALIRSNLPCASESDVSSERTTTKMVIEVVVERAPMEGPTQRWIA